MFELSNGDRIGYRPRSKGGIATVDTRILNRSPRFIKLKFIR